MHREGRGGGEIGEIGYLELDLELIETKHVVTLLWQIAGSSAMAHITANGMESKLQITVLW